MAVADLAVRVSADIKNFEDNLSKAEKTLTKTSKTLGDVGGKLTKGLTVPILAAGAGLYALVQKTATAGDEIQKMALRTGFSTESLSELRHAADLSGTSLESLETGVKRMQRSIYDAERGLSTATEALAAMGLTTQQLQGLSPEQQFEKITMALADVSDASTRAALAQQIFGRAGTDLLPMLASGADGIAAMRQEAHDLGIVFDQDAADAAAKFNDDMDRLKKGFTGVFQELGTKLIPIFVDTLIPMVRDTIVPLVGNFIEKIVRLAEWFGNLSPTMQKIIIGFVGFLAAVGPALLIISKIIAAMTTILPLIQKITILKKAWTVVQAALNVVLSANPIGLVIIAIAALIAIIVLVIKNWDKLKEVAGKVGDWIVDKWNKVMDFFRGFRDKIVETFNNVKDKVLGIWTSITDGIKGFINKIIDGINYLIRGINKIPGVNIGEVGKLKLSTDIPGAAAGGYVTRPGTVLVGERGPELLHLPRGAAVQPLGAGTYNINVTIPARDLEEMRTVQDFFARIQRTSRMMGV